MPPRVDASLPWWIPDSDMRCPHCDSTRCLCTVEPENETEQVLTLADDGFEEEELEDEPEENAHVQALDFAHTLFALYDSMTTQQVRLWNRLAPEFNKKNAAVPCFCLPDPCK